MLVTTTIPYGTDEANLDKVIVNPHESFVHGQQWQCSDKSWLYQQHQRLGTY